MNIADLRSAIKDVLTPINLYSEAAEELLCATCANESNLGQYRVQADGPARGIFQIEGSDFSDIWNNYLKYHFTLASYVKGLNNGNVGTVDDLVSNDRYSIALARIHYARCPGYLPQAGDLDGIWNYYKTYYNTPRGAATEATFKEKYQKYVLGE
jgi:hypothetical protein